MDWRNSSACHADQDGECSWRRCPQLRDNEPYQSGRHCPLDLISPETHTEEEYRAAVQKILDAPPSLTEPRRQRKD